MASRRQFLKKAGLVSSISVLPYLAKGVANNTGSESSSAFPGIFSPEEVRKELLVPPGRIYLNTGSLGPSPNAVLEAVFNSMRQLEKDPVTENWGPLGKKMEEVRQIVGEFINADTDEVILTRNTTEGLELVCQTLSLNPGDEILTTTLEHGGGEVGLEFLVKTRGAVLKKVELPLPPKTEQEIVDIISANITTRTKLVMLSHVNTVTGLIMPFDLIAAITRPKGIFLLSDGAQAPGLTPVDVKRLGVDAYSSSGHKWILGPKETGFLYVRKEIHSVFRPIFTLSGFSTYTASSGTRNVATIIGLGEAIQWRRRLGQEAILKHCTDLRDYCQKELSKLKGLKLISPETGSLSTAIVTFSLDSAKNGDIYARLKEQDIIVKVLPQHNAIRISCHLFVSKQDIDKFINALKPLV